MLEQIPFLQHCEDDDSDEDDELDGAQHRKQRVKVSAPAPPWRSPVQEEPPPVCPVGKRGTAALHSWDLQRGPRAKLEPGVR